MPLPDKSTLRETFRRKRDALHAADHAKFSHAVCEQVVPLIASLARPGFIIAGYVPMRSELEITPALKKLSVGHSIALPVVIENLGLSFRRYHPGDTLEKNSLGVFEPLPEAEPVVPDLLIVPLLAFDRSGHRLGWGAGYYDKALAALRQAKSITAIGIAFSLQEAEALPAETFDQRLDAVVTERETIRF